jgi:hypothetical protein
MEQRAHDVFARLAEREEPPLGFTADDVMTRGRRQARARRVGTVVGGAVGTLAVAAAVLPLVSLGSGRHPAGPEATVTAPTTPAPVRSPSPAAPDPGCVADLGKSAAPEARFEGPEKTAALQACPVLKRVNAVLDPGGTHLWASDPGFHHSAPVDIVNGFSTAANATKLDGVESQIWWTPDGHYPFKNDDKPDMVGPYVQIRTSIRAGGRPDPYANAPDHRDNGLQGNGKAAAGLPWGPATVTTLPDGSTVSLKKEQDSAGAAVVATRTLRSGAQLILYVSGPDQAPGMSTLSFTDQQLIAAVSVSGIEDVQLPFDSTVPRAGGRPSGPSAPSTPSTPSSTPSSR